MFVEDGEQVDNAEISDSAPGVETIVVFDPRGTHHYDDPRLMTGLISENRASALAKHLTSYRSNSPNSIRTPPPWSSIHRGPQANRRGLCCRRSTPWHSLNASFRS